VLTDTAGRFRLGELPDGDSTLEAYAADVGRAHAEVHLFAGTTSPDVRLQLLRERGSSSTAESSAGVAVTLGERTAEREVVIVAVAEGSQAERAGLVPGDLLVTVDGQAVGTIEEARARLTGPLVDDVLVEVRREGATFKYRLARESIRR
jgi:C-terminal processing protease CtpA/Prc